MEGGQEWMKWKSVERTDQWKKGSGVVEAEAEGREGKKGEWL